MPLEVPVAVRPWDSAAKNSWELARDPTLPGMSGCCASLPCCAALSCSHQLPAKGLSDAQAEIRTAWNNFFLENMHLCAQTCSAGILTGHQWSQTHSSVPGFLTYALELSSFTVCSIYQDGSHQEGLGAFRASHSWQHFPFLGQGQSAEKGIWRILNWKAG